MPDKTEYLPATEETYKSLQTFETREALNEAVRQHKRKNRYDLSDTHKEILFIMARYAVKYTGVCFLSYNKIAEKAGCKHRTVQRACQRMESLGIIKRYATKRIRGDKRRAANAIVILPFPEPAEPKQSQRVDVTEGRNKETLSNAPDNKKPKSTNDTQRRHKPLIPRPLEARTEPDPMDSTFLRGSIPSALY